MTSALYKIISDGIIGFLRRRRVKTRGLRLPCRDLATPLLLGLPSFFTRQLRAICN